MSLNKEDLKNKIIYRASYRGTKEMDILMTGFVKTIIDKLDNEQLIRLNDFVNMDDEILTSIKNKESTLNIKDVFLIDIIDKFQKHTL
tara:strand:+ start:54 stop:317 length:264 start_codon:yes stop_codon:yes gene_type:complete